MLIDLSFFLYFISLLSFVGGLAFLLFFVSLSLVLFCCAPGLVLGVCFFVFVFNSLLGMIHRRGGGGPGR